MATSKEYREMSDEQLGTELVQTQKDLFKLRFQASTEKLDAPSSLKKLRRSIARISTIRRERELKAAQA